MAKQEYEKVIIKTVLFEKADIVTVSDGDGENYGSVNKIWYGSTGGGNS